MEHTVHESNFTHRRKSLWKTGLLMTFHRGYVEVINKNVRCTWIACGHSLMFLCFQYFRRTHRHRMWLRYDGCICVCTFVSALEWLQMEKDWHVMDPSPPLTHTWVPSNHGAYNVGIYYYVHIIHMVVYVCMCCWDYVTLYYILYEVSHMAPKWYIASNTAAHIIYVV